MLLIKTCSDGSQHEKRLKRASWVTLVSQQSQKFWKITSLLEKIKKIKWIAPLSSKIQILILKLFHILTISFSCWIKNTIWLFNVYTWVRIRPVKSSRFIKYLSDLSSRKVLSFVSKVQFFYKWRNRYSLMLLIHLLYKQLSL